MRLLREYIRTLLESNGSFIPAIAGWFDRKNRGAFVKEFPEGCVVQITISQEEEDHYIIDMIETLGDDCLRKGYASQVMRFVTQAASNNSIALSLDAEGWPDGPSSEELEDWYSDFGFEYDLWGNYGMRREP